MTRNKRNKANLEQKITELYIRSTKRKTSKISRKINLQKRLEFFKNLLNEEIKKEQHISPEASVDTTEASTPAGE